MSSAYNAAAVWQKILSDTAKNRGLLCDIERFARENTAPARIVFGTSGWRGEIGTDFTFNNLRIVTTAIVGVLRSNEPSVLAALGVSGFEDVQQRGVIVGHDNRFLGREFAMEVIGILRKEDVRVWYAGEAATPEFSAGIEMLGAACAINLTPSHNPANYAGLKFNPADGGPAGTEITSRIEEIANRIMLSSPTLPSAHPGAVEHIDLTGLYREYLTRRGTIDLERIRDFLASGDCLVCIDSVHGATRGRVQRLLGDNSSVLCLRTEDDVLFGGVAPEPSEGNMAAVEAALAAGRARLKLGVIMDPDGDRIRFCDGSRQIPMNYFGAMALHFLHVHKGFNGVVVKSAGTSSFVDAIAGRLGIPVRETRVGFKNFRPFLLGAAAERAIVAFEESDGITGYNHTLEKDALFGLLLAIEMMAATGKNLGAYLQELMAEYGQYYPDRSGISVDRAVAGEPLAEKLSEIARRYPPGAIISIGGHERTVQDLITIDGTKLVFDDGSWLMIRPSGTEPKVRFYIEARTEEAKTAVFETAERLVGEALAD